MQIAKPLFALAFLNLACGAAPLTAAAPVAVDEAARPLLAGVFTPRAHEAAGGARIEETSEGLRLVFDADFVVDNGPALSVYLSPIDAEELTRANGIDDAINLGALQAVTGEQAYALPADADLEEVRSVHVWCDDFSVLFGAAPLAASES
jgi:hypothetical protein